MKGYEAIEYFHPYYSSYGEKEMNKRLLEVGIDSPNDTFSPDNMYYAEIISSGHERDSSGDHVVLWKRII